MVVQLRTLKQGVIYEVTVNTKSGYEVSSYTATGATITNTAGAHTTFTPSGNSTLTVVSTTAAPTHTVTVSMDSNIYYVVFHSDEYGDKVAISNKPTVELRENTTYTVTAYPVKDHTFASWSTTANGTLGSTSANPTTYIVTDDATLTVTGQ